MTVAELIEVLRAMPQDLPLVVAHEVGYIADLEFHRETLPPGAFGLNTALPNGDDVIVLNACT